MLTIKRGADIEQYHYWHIVVLPQMRSMDGSFTKPQSDLLRPFRAALSETRTSSKERRHAAVTQCARQLIGHACRAAGIGPQEPEAPADTITDIIEAIAPPALEGVTQVLEFQAID